MSLGIEGFDHLTVIVTDMADPNRSIFKLFGTR